MSAGITTIQLRAETRDALRRLAAKGESYDDVIAELLEGYEAYLDVLEERFEQERGEAVPMEEVFDEIERSLSPKRRAGARASRET